MIRHPARWILALMLIFLVVPSIIRGAPDNSKVDHDIDEITKDKNYDWLRNSDMPKKGQTKSECSGDNCKSESKQTAVERDPGCSYSPGGVSQNDTSDTNDCGGSSSPGSCGLDNTLGNCDCGGTLGKCGCGSTIGACSCGPIGAVAAPSGYLLAAVGLAVFVFFVVWAILRTEPTASVEQQFIPNDSPQALSVSKIPETPMEQMMALARKSALSGDYKSAVGWSYMAGIGQLHRAGYVDIRRSTTNFEIVDSVRRSQGPQEATRQLVDTFEELFFGAHTPTSKHWETCKQIVEVDLG